MVVMVTQYHNSMTQTAPRGSVATLSDCAYTLTSPGSIAASGFEERCPLEGFERDG
jgi:hypothetical protein